MPDSWPTPLCPAGHRLQARHALVGWQHCHCPGSRYGGHRSYFCTDHELEVLTPPCLVKRQPFGLLGFRR